MTSPASDPRDRSDGLGPECGEGLEECRCEHVLGRQAIRKCALRRLALRRSARARAGRDPAGDFGDSLHAGITGAATEMWLSNHVPAAPLLSIPGCSYPCKLQRSPAPQPRDFPRPRAPGLPRCAGSGGLQGRPVFRSMYSRMSRRTICDGVTSSSAQSCSKAAFLRGSMRTVSRAVRSSIGIECSPEIRWRRI
jgi:hypothetical protein